MNPRYYQPEQRQSNTDKSINQLGSIMSIIAPFLAPEIANPQLDENKRQFDAQAPLRDAGVQELTSRSALNTAQAVDPSRKMAAEADMGRNLVAKQATEQQGKAATLNAAPELLQALSAIGIKKPQLAQYFGALDPQFGQINQAAEQQTSALTQKIMAGQELTPEEQAAAASDPRLQMFMAIHKTTKKTK